MKRNIKSKIFYCSRVMRESLQSEKPYSHYTSHLSEQQLVKFNIAKLKYNLFPLLICYNILVCDTKCIIWKSSSNFDLIHPSLSLKRIVYEKKQECLPLRLRLHVPKRVQLLRIWTFLKVCSKTMEGYITALLHIAVCEL